MASQEARKASSGRARRSEGKYASVGIIAAWRLAPFLAMAIQSGTAKLMGEKAFEDTDAQLYVECGQRHLLTI
jgi:hypothetical protein